MKGNNKLCLNHFPTIRNHSDYWKIGRDYHIELKGSRPFLSCLRNKKTVKFAKISPEFLIFDTGLNYDNAIHLFQKLMKCSTIDELKEKVVDVLYFERVIKVNYKIV